jgi:hypothetical protein
MLNSKRIIGCFLNKIERTIKFKEGTWTVKEINKNKFFNE